MNLSSFSIPSQWNLFLILGLIYIYVQISRMSHWLNVGFVMRMIDDRVAAVVTIRTRLWWSGRRMATSEDKKRQRPYLTCICAFAIARLAPLIGRKEDKRRKLILLFLTQFWDWISVRAVFLIEFHHIELLESLFF